MTDAESPAPAAGAEEPSIEEILASIRKIISDEPAPQGEAAAEVTPDMPMPENLDKPIDEPNDVLDLSAYAEAPANETADHILPEPEHSTFENNFDLGLEESDNTDSMAPDMDISSIMAASEFISSPLPSMPDSLISPNIADAATAAFARLNQAASHSESAPAQTQLWVGARTIEQVVEDLMRPMLRTWLDQNLPRLVERLVEKELARMARRASE